MDSCYLPAEQPVLSSTPAALDIPAYRLEVCRPGHPARALAESYIQQAYTRAHDARVRTFMDELFCLHDRADAIAGVVGVRSAVRNRLFLERYLQAPIQSAIASALPCAQSGRTREIERERIAEIGNFACRNSQLARILMLLLARELLQRRVQWVAFTATRSVRAILQSFHAPLLELSRATATAVAGCPDDWGGYYRTDPRVMALHLPNALRIAERDQ